MCNSGHSASQTRVNALVALPPPERGRVVVGVNLYAKLAPTQLSIERRRRACIDVTSCMQTPTPILPLSGGGSRPPARHRESN